MGMKKTAKRSIVNHQVPLPLSSPVVIAPPDFSALLSNPLVKLPPPSDFNLTLEVEHLKKLWIESEELRRYLFQAFVYAGGTGMVFKALPPSGSPSVALKVLRASVAARDPKNSNLPTSLSPASAQELRALSTLSHHNIVRLFDVIGSDRGVLAIATAFINEPQPLDQYLVNTLKKHPDPQGRKGISRFSPERLENACAFLIDRFRDIADAVAYMHENHLFHCDIKPANILVDSRQQVFLADLGSCVHEQDADRAGFLRIHFTWTYAHPGLTDIASDPKGISGGGLKASAKVPVSAGLARYDLFAIGRTIQESLAQLVREFGERCYATYSFRYLHLLAALLLDGHVTPLKESLRFKDGRHFIKDVALGYPVEIFLRKKLISAKQLKYRLDRFRLGAWPHHELPELDRWYPEVINTGTGAPIPFSRRVAAVFNHPSLRRLRSELQLGWIREIYPGAYHSRWSHSLGVFHAMIQYYAALVADPEVPTARILLDPVDIEHGLVAAMLHDIGQTTFGHDFESATPNLCPHEELFKRLLDETFWGPLTLRHVITRYWPKVNIDRVLSILNFRQAELAESKARAYLDPVDGLATDIISGPIDADKLDYLVRDAVACGVPYGRSIDLERFLRAITTDVKQVSGLPRLALAYRSKGAASIESLLLARYQMFGAVYWHHTFRCIQAMFSHAAFNTFGRINNGKILIRGVKLDAELVRDLFYYRVVCGLSLEICQNLPKIKGLAVPPEFFRRVPVEISSEAALEFVWICADNPTRIIIDRLARRDLFKRVFELRTGDLAEHGDYSALSQALDPQQRDGICQKLTKGFLDAVYKKMQQRGPIESASENEARRRHGELLRAEYPLVVIDYPTRGVPEERNFPRAIGDPARKYIAGRGGEAGSGRSVFHTVRNLQLAIASLRVFAAPEFHELIVRYLDPQDVHDCIENVIPAIRVQQ